jgi:hypothetical protein
MSDKVLDQRKKMLNSIRDLVGLEEKDRLDYVKSIKIHLAYLGQSLAGWGKWVNNPEIMATFTKNELEEIESNLYSITEDFIKHDIETMKVAQEKGLRIRPRKEKENIKFII